MESFIQAILPSVFYAVGIVLGALCIFVVKKYLVPFIQQKIGVEQYNSLTEKCKDLMASAESLFTEKGSGESKQAWVIAQLKALGLTFDEDLVTNLIKGFTKELTAQGVINTAK